MSRRSTSLVAAVALTLSILAALAAPDSASAQAAQPAALALSPAAAAQLRGQYLADLDSVHVKLIALATAIPESRYGWRPAPGTRSVSEVLMHLTGEWYYYCPKSVGADAPADFGNPPRTKLEALEHITAKKEVMDQLQKSWTYCAAQLATVDAAGLTEKYKPWGVTLGEAAFSMTGDQHEHLGQLIAYARAVGVKPPWTK